ncbi:N-alpha-acetyltransferase 20 [Drosophila guanche]|uniref:N-alpha-acetyltransferase 20 n=1 Tax=Drosophila guanche TaxID=7266 RepID=A0A3B0KJ14_DROGU|nr:N-alpha-acetyltransferase 20 [Drosophila guanche]SPP85746.1 blast:N-alpha-acetyltransferase 20 [Drosophila guanche]
MTSLRELVPADLFKFNSIVFDPFVEGYHMNFYLRKMIQNPKLCQVAVAPDDRLIGLLVSTRGVSKNKIGEEFRPTYGHISLLAVAADYRRLGLATCLMGQFTETVERYADWYVDLYVRPSNLTAMQLYESLGFVKFRWLSYFYENEHGYELRMPLCRDVERKSLKGITKYRFYWLYQLPYALFKEFLKGLKVLFFW